MPRGPNLSSRDQEQILALYRHGIGPDELAARFDRHPKTIRALLRRLAVDLPDGRKLRKVQLGAIKISDQMTEHQRVLAILDLQEQIEREPTAWRKAELREQMAKAVAKG